VRSMPGSAVRMRTAAGGAVRVQLLLLPPALLVGIGAATARGGVWLVLLGPAAVLLVANARAIARAGIRSLAGAAGNAALVTAAAMLLALGLGPALGLYRTITVLSGSRRPAFAPGDVIVVTPEPARDLRVGQVITYQIPVDGRRVETHRVVRILRPGEEPIVQTKGDANNAPDPWQAQLHGGTLWRYRLRIPLLGYPILALRAPLTHWILVTLLPALLALYWLVELWRPARRTRSSIPAHARTNA
jgi:signal peptidase I